MYGKQCGVADYGEPVVFVHVINNSYYDHGLTHYLSQAQNLLRYILGRAMTEFIYAIIRDDEIVTTKRLPEKADPAQVCKALELQEDVNSGRDLTGFYHDYLVVDEMEATFERAQYRVIRFPQPEGFNGQYYRSQDDLAHFDCVEMDYRLQKIALAHKYVPPTEDDSWRHDWRKAFQIFEMQFGTIH